MTANAAFSPARRSFLRGKPSESGPLRPPWAIAEGDFLESCTRCGDCLSACPEGVLTRGDGGFPVFDPSRGACTFCGACVGGCQTGALRQDADQTPWDLTAQISSACLAKNGVTCFSCRDACGDVAIRFQLAQGGATPAVKADACTGCGACVSVCPVSAISLARKETADGR